MSDTVTIDDFAPRVLPAHWRQEEVPPVTRRGGNPVPLTHIRAYSHVRTRVFIILELEDRKKVGLWLHASVSGRGRLPTWEELADVKQVLFGDRAVIQVLPPKKYYVNLHQHCLHLFDRLDAETVPRDLWGAM